MRLILLILFLLMVNHTIPYAQSATPLLAEIAVHKRIEVPKAPIQKKTPKKIRQERRKVKQKKRKKYRINQTKQKNRAWNGSLTAGLIGLFLLQAIPATFAFLTFWGIAIYISPLLLVLLILTFGIIVMAIYLGLIIGSPLLIGLGVNDLQRKTAANTGIASAIIVISAIYLALLGFIFLFFTSLGLAALILQGILMLPGILGMVLGLMKIIGAIPREKRERHNYYDGYDY